MSAAPAARIAAKFALAVALVVVGAAAWTWPLATRLSTHTVVPGAVTPPEQADRGGWDLLLANDQKLSLWGAVSNGRALLRGDPGALLEQGQCRPMPSSAVLGEHMVEQGLLALPWLAMGAGPVAAYNLALLLALVVAATGMLAFLGGLGVRSAVALPMALAFAFATPRLADLPVHPAVVGTHWLPWVLWGFDRVLARGSVAAACCFLLALLPACFVGSYPLLGTAAVGAAYAASRLLAEARRGTPAWSRLPWIACAALPALGGVGLLLAEYGAQHAQWQVASNPEAKFLVGPSDFLPGGAAWVGIPAVVGLALLWPRALRRGLREGLPPGALVGLVAALLATALVALRWPLPGGGSWSAYGSLSTLLPLLDSARAPGRVAHASLLVLLSLAALGWQALAQQLDASRNGRSRGAGLLLAAALASSALVPPRFAAPMRLEAVAPDAQRLRVLEVLRAASRPGDVVLDLPVGRMGRSPIALRDAAWHGLASTACYNSLVPPTMRAVYALAARIHAPEGVAEASAAGIAFVLDRGNAALPPPASLLASGGGISAWKLPAAPRPQEAASGESPAPVVGDADVPAAGKAADTPATEAPELLAGDASAAREASSLALQVVGGATRGATFAPESPHELDLRWSNAGPGTWAAPRPLQPLRARVEFVDGAGRSLASVLASGTWPLAVAASSGVVLALPLPAPPPPGTDRVRVWVDGMAPVESAPGFRWGNAAP